MRPAEIRTVNEELARREGWKLRTIWEGGNNVSRWIPPNGGVRDAQEDPPTYHRPEDAANLIRVLGSLSDVQKRAIEDGVYELSGVTTDEYDLLGEEGIIDHGLFWLDLWTHHPDKLARIVAAVVRDG